jgi:hypothetical protein
MQLGPIRTISEAERVPLRRDDLAGRADVDAIAAHGFTVLDLCDRQARALLEEFVMNAFLIGREVSYADEAGTRDGRLPRHAERRDDRRAPPLAGLGARIAALAGTPCAPAADMPWDIGIELKIAGLEGARMANENLSGELSPYNHPHCNGVLQEIEDGPLTRFRRHMGHAYTMETRADSENKALDRGLFDILRAHRGRAA